MAVINLNDNFSLTGKNSKEFFDAIKEMSDITEYMTVKSSDIELLSVVPEKSNETQICVLHHNNEKTKYRYLNKDALRKKGASQELIEEAMNENKLFLFINGKLYFTSLSLLDTLSSRLDIKGGRIRIPSLCRDKYFFETMNASPFNTKIMLRKNESLKKVYASFTKRYAELPQKMLERIIENLSEHGLGECVCDRWYVDHFLSSIYLQFPEKAKDFAGMYGLKDEIIPGLYLAISDTGDCSFTAKETWTVNGITSCKNYYKREHKGTIDVEELLDRMDKTLFSKYTLVPEKLCELQMIEVENVAETYKSIFKQIGIVDAVKRDVKKQLLEELCMEINPSLSYTAYDIAVTMMCLPGRCHGLSKASVEKLNNIVVNAVFADYSKPKQSEIFLTS